MYSPQDDLAISSLYEDSQYQLHIQTDIGQSQLPDPRSSYAHASTSASSSTSSYPPPPPPTSPSPGPHTATEYCAPNWVLDPVYRTPYRVPHPDAPARSLWYPPPPVNIPQPSYPGSESHPKNTRQVSMCLLSRPACPTYHPRVFPAATIGLRVTIAVIFYHHRFHLPFLTTKISVLSRTMAVSRSLFPMYICKRRQNPTSCNIQGPLCHKASTLIL
jgi:hypothetical protein